jgi:hypothetical protein
VLRDGACVALSARRDAGRAKQTLCTPSSAQTDITLTVRMTNGFMVAGPSGP